MNTYVSTQYEFVPTEYKDKNCNDLFFEINIKIQHSL